MRRAHCELLELRLLRSATGGWRRARAGAAHAAAEPIERGGRRVLRKRDPPAVGRNGATSATATSKEPKGGLTLTLARGDPERGRKRPGGGGRQTGREPADRGGQLRRAGNAARGQAAVSAVEIARLTRWVERGLPWPDNRSARRLARRSAAAEAEQIADGAEQLLVVPAGAQSAAAGGARTPPGRKRPIDRFVLAELEKRGLSPSPPADKRTLLRRLTFDLIGLPPTPEEIDDFLADDSPEAVGTRGRSAARLAALRRALGPALARRGPLCRHQGLRALPGRRTFPGRTPTAITSSGRSTRTCPTTGSSSSSWRPTSCRWAATNGR